MPTTITIGKQGDQWFSIDSKCTKVSRRHAILTIPDNQDEPWFLEDNHSTNGTFIRNENGQMIQISRTEITPLTFIQLGTADAQGCSFYATKCLVENKKNPNRYNKEFTHIRKELAKLKKLFDSEKKRRDWQRKVNRYSGIIIYVFMVILEAYSDGSNAKLLSLSKYLVKYLPILLIGLYQWWVNRKGKLNLVKQRMDAICRCPNPNCNHRLNKDEEIPNGLCNRCGAHI